MFNHFLFSVLLIKTQLLFYNSFWTEESSRSALREICQEISQVYSGFFKIWFEASRKQQYLVSKKTECLQQEISLHIKVTTKTHETDYEMPCTSGTGDRQKTSKTWTLDGVFVTVCVRGVPRCTAGSLPGLFGSFDCLSV